MNDFNQRDRIVRYRIDYEKELNAAQIEAVSFKEGALLVIAGAGSGKTRTLTYRVARLVEEGVPPQSILLLTFTRKASAEMLSRASRLLDNRCGKAAGGTFHSFANATLRRYAAAIGGQSDFTIIDRSDAESLVGMIRKEIAKDINRRGFPRNQTLLNIFSKSVNKSIPVEEVIYDDYPHFSVSVAPILAINESYQERKQQHKLLDFDDLLLNLHRVLKEQSDLRRKIAAAYRYIMVDEYQDTNQIQADILYLLAGDNPNVMAVGDDSQSIYAFRGANFKNIMKFPEIFPGTTIIRLEENYRSREPILNLTNKIIDRATEKYEKKLFTRKVGGKTPCLVETESENGQSKYIVDRIVALHDDGMPLDQIAVLFRASFHSFDLEIELTRRNIAYVKVGGFRFIESAHIKDVLAHLRVVANAADRISWYRLLLLINKIGPKSAQNIFQAVIDQSAGFSGLINLRKEFKPNRGLERLMELFCIIDARPMSVAQMGEVVINYYGPIVREKYDDYPRRLKDLEQLLSIMDRYRSLEAFLSDMALEPPNVSKGKVLSPSDTDQAHLVLSTIHSAKGLEWHTVFIIWALDGRFPSIHALNSQADLEEELRLMYVAATRAREMLFISYPGEIYDRGSGLLLNNPSRFIDGIPDDTLERKYIGYYLDLA